MKVKNNGMVIIEKIQFEDIRKRTVLKNNATSGKITVPTYWIGKEVFVVAPPK